MSEKWRILIYHFREHVHTHGKRGYDWGWSRARPGKMANLRCKCMYIYVSMHVHTRTHTHTHRVCLCVYSGTVCHAHSCDLQLMKLGCSRVACQINMSSILSLPPPPLFLLLVYHRPHQRDTYSLYPLPS